PLFNASNRAEGQRKAGVLMSLLYRAIWQEDREHLLDVGAATALGWLRSRGISLDALPDGELSGEHTDLRFGKSVGHVLWTRRSSAGGVDGLRVRLEETHAEAG